MADGVGHPVRSAGGLEIAFAHARLRLLPERAVWWDAERTLLIADAHLGKPASFRAGGAPVPEQATRADLDRLSALLRAHDARRLVVLGDLAHDRAAWGRATMASFAAWRGAHTELEVVLVRGNHDRRAADPPSELGIACVEPGWELGGIAMHHEPRETGGGSPALAGHLHPGARLRADRRRGGGRGGRGGGMRVPCFWAQRDQLVLPAFGSFTGLWMISPRPGDRVFAVGPGVVRAVEEAG